MKTKQTKASLLLLLPLALAGCSSKESNKIEVDPPFRIETEKVIQYDGDNSLKYSGVVEARQTTPLSFSTLGTVVSISAEEGQHVRRGQLLAKLNSSNADNTYELALQKLQQAEDAYTRLKPMNENGTVSQIKWVEVETGVSQARAAVAIAQKAVADCNLYAISDGVIGRKYIQPGVNILPASPAFDVLDIRSVYIRVAVPEAEIGSIKKGMVASFDIPAISKTATGTIEDIGVSADILSHTYPVKIKVSNEDLSIKPGMICSVQINVNKNLKGFLISNKALQFDAHGKQFVYIVENNVAQKRDVETISLVGAKVMVKGNIRENETIIISGQGKLHPGSTVR